MCTMMAFQPAWNTTMAKLFNFGRVFSVSHNTNWRYFRGREKCTFAPQVAQIMRKTRKRPVYTRETPHTLCLISKYRRNVSCRSYSVHFRPYCTANNGVTDFDLRKVYKQCVQALHEAGISQSAIEAREIIKKVLRERLHESTFLFLARCEEKISVKEKDEIAKSLSRRVKGEPLAYITGEKEFWSLPFYVNHHTLIPRPDSETLVEAFLDRYKQNKQISDRQSRESNASDMTILDLGTGSGCLLLAALSEIPNAKGIGIDMDPEAVRLAQRSAQRLELDDRASFVEYDFTKLDCEILRACIFNRFTLSSGERSENDGCVDVILSNPPYIGWNEASYMSKSALQFEPYSALFAGEDGLDCYRSLAKVVPSLLRPGGLLFLEVGFEQSQSVAEILCDAGALRLEGTRKDLSGIVRCVILSKAVKE